MAHKSCSTKNGRKKVDHNGKKFFDSMKNSSAVIYDYQTNNVRDDRLLRKKCFILSNNLIIFTGNEMRKKKIQKLPFFHL